MYLMPLWFSLISCIVSMCIGMLIGNVGVFYIAISCVFICVASSFYIFYEVCLHGVTCSIYLFDLLCIDTLDVHICLLYDPLSVSMLIIINLISLCAHIYLVEYMSADMHIIRFFSYLSLFTFFMIL